MVDHPSGYFLFGFEQVETLPPVPNLISNRWQLHPPFQISFRTGDDPTARSKSHFEQVAAYFSDFAQIKNSFKS
jgi:hypothetical protein